MTKKLMSLGWILCQGPDQQCAIKALFSVVAADLDCRLFVGCWLGRLGMMATANSDVVPVVDSDGVAAVDFGIL